MLEVVCTYVLSPLSVNLLTSLLSSYDSVLNLLVSSSLPPERLDICYLNFCYLNI